MANFRQDPNSRITTVDVPMVEGPMSVIGEYLQTRQSGPCRDFEMDYIRCAARVGAYHNQRLCSKLLDDYQECVTKHKSLMRYYAMQEERKKQGKPFLPPPPQDGVWHAVGQCMQ